jgi:hypothetical protein
MKKIKNGRIIIIKIPLIPKKISKLSLKKLIEKRFKYIMKINERAE